MSSIADSKKDSSSNKGFRGIGRLGGISACQTLIFECSYYGEPVKSSVIWDAQKIKDILNDSENNPDAATLVDDTTIYYEEECGIDEHFFIVKMIGIEKSAKDLLNIDKVKNYLQAVAPLPFSPGFLFQKKIKDFAMASGFSFDEYNVFVNGDRLYKPYTTKLYEPKNDQKTEYDELFDIRFEIFRDKNDEILAWMWYGISRFEKAIPVCNAMRGIRIRKGNIQIGNEETFFNQGLFKEPRGFQYFVGEVHAISPSLRPNARRDYFNKNGTCKEFEDLLYPILYTDFYKIYHNANSEKNAYKKIQELHDAQEVYEQKTQNGFVSDDEKRKLEEETINFVKQLCKDEKDVMIGGVLASILPDRVEAATGIRPHVGTLDTPGQLDEGNDMVIDTLPLDYSILEEIDYQYPANNAYFAYMTRGCVNKCSFCAVPRLEPIYKQFLPVSEQVRIAEEKYGAKRDLLLLDNNVLASCRYNDIIEDIKTAGFAQGATYIPPNLFEIAIKNLRDGQNDRGYIRLCVKQFILLLSKCPKDNKQELEQFFRENYLLEYHTARKDVILSNYEYLSPFFEKIYSSRPRKRYVDFNQGIDSRLITEENMGKLAEIPVKPVRIAFDHWELHEIYEKSVRTAIKNGHTSLSNYILYNFKDKPEELYWRLKLNVDLCEELGASIYSFPMKYHPIEDPDYFSNRDYIGVHWNRKFIRTIQAILNSTKGKVGKGKDFFEKAFGKDLDEFFKLLYMPEAMIIYRLYFEGIGLTDEWWDAYSQLSESEFGYVNSCSKLHRRILSLL